MTATAQYMTVAGEFGFRAARHGDLSNPQGDLLTIAGDRVRLFLKDGRVFTCYSPERFRDLLRRLYPESANTDPHQLTLF